MTCDNMYRFAISPTDMITIREMADARSIPHDRICFRYVQGTPPVGDHWEAHDLDDMVVPIACMCCVSGNWVEGALDG